MKSLPPRMVERAVKTYEQQKDTINLLLLDLTMPILGGLEAVELLKKINPDVRVILLSGYNIPEEAGKSFGENVVGFIKKPFEIKELSNAVIQAFANTAN